jgi:signal transduction histidine kinase
MKSRNETILQTGQGNEAELWLRSGLPEYAGKTLQEKINLFNQPVKFDREKIRMLLVDENIHDVVRLRGILHKIECWSIEIDWGQDIEHALEKIGYNAYDFCMIDLDLVLKKQIDLVRIVSCNVRNIPLIFLNNTTDDTILTSFSDSEFTECIKKSALSPELLKLCIRYTMERSQRVKKLEDARKYLLELSSKLINAQEQERKLIGRELHDSIGSTLTAIRMILDADQHQAEADSGSVGKISFKALQSMIDDTIEETRRISEKLRPAILDDLGLVKTIGWMCNNLQTLLPDTAVHTDIGINDSQVPASLKIVIYRILQEALNNIVKHSRADVVDLALKITGDRLELVIRDNGNGFDPENLPAPNPESGGYGLQGMRDRTEFTEGNFSITSEIDEGTTIRIQWPID